jgi:hypothetical protein
MTKIPIKTRLPVEAWLLAALVTLFSLVCSIARSPATDAPSVAHAKLMSDNGTLITPTIR